MKTSLSDHRIFRPAQSDDNLMFPEYLSITYVEGVFWRAPYFDEPVFPRYVYRTIKVNGWNTAEEYEGTLGLFWDPDFNNPPVDLAEHMKSRELLDGADVLVSRG